MANQKFRDHLDTTTKKSGNNITTRACKQLFISRIYLYPILKEISDLELSQE
jgi:hypothetical protein